MKIEFLDHKKKVRFIDLAVGEVFCCCDAEPRLYMKVQIMDMTSDDDVDDVGAVNLSTGNVISFSLKEEVIVYKATLIAERL